MSFITVKFIDKEYSIPTDVITYVSLVDFTNKIRDTLVASFKKQICPSIDVIESDNFMIATINEQVAQFVRKLLENDIYDRTANDYLQGNKGYELFLDTKKKVLRQLISIRQEKLETYRAGVEGAIYRKEASVTGLDFGIISSSFVNHMIYAYMDASKQTKQEQEALKTYNREIAELDKQAAEYDRQENAYIADNVIPAMNTVFTFFAYELLDKYVSDFIKVGKFDKAALDFINLERSNDLLENINLAGNKRAVIESAFAACPFNMAVYMHAMKLEMLDEDTFETANVLKQGSKIISFLKESMGSADYPNFTEPNYYSASLLARYTNTSANDVLYRHTSSYANTVIREYEKIVKALDNSNQCREYLRKLSDDEILSGEGASKRLAKSLVYSISPNDNWSILVKQCGHADLLERLQDIMPTGSSVGSKADCDSYLAEALFNALEVTRKDLAQRILESRTRAEAERQKLEAQKRKKRIKTTAIVCAIVAIVIFAISLPTIIENAKIAKRESYVEKQIQEVVMPLEKQMEDATGVDIIIDYSFSLENDWDTEQWYEWTFSVKLPIFEEYRKSNSATDQALLEVMDVCKTLVEIYDNIYDELDFDSNEGDVRIVMDFSGGNFGSLKIHDTSTLETFYYEEHSGNRYLHSSNTEYVLDKNSEVSQAAQKEAAYNEALALMSTQKYDEAIEIFTKLGGYKNSATKIIECNNAIAAIIESKYNKASSLLTEGKYEEALEIFVELADYKDSENKITECNTAIAENEYDNAVALINEGDYVAAYDILIKLNHYPDAANLLKNFKRVPTESTYISAKSSESNSYHTYTYNDNGILIEEVINNSTVVTYSYDSYGNVIMKKYTYSDGDTSQYEYKYNASNQLVQERFTYPDGSIDVVNYTYDSNGRISEAEDIHWGNFNEKLTYSYDSTGKLIKKDTIDHFNSFGCYEYQYDGHGRLIKEIRTTDIGKTYSVVYTTEYSYSTDGYLIAVYEYKDDRKTGYEVFDEYIVFYSPEGFSN